MRALCLGALVGLAAAPATAQRATFEGTLDLDVRTALHTDFPYQRTDRVNTAELRLNGAADARTRWSVAAQRKFFTDRLTLAQVERSLPAGVSVRAGLLRAPFGIWDTQETYRSGIIDYPMPRVDSGDNGVDYAVRGVGATLLRGRWQADGALFSGPGVSVWNGSKRLSGAVGRLQAFLPPRTIVGVSHWSGDQPSYAGPPSSLTLTGLDLRTALPYVVVRAEALFGKLAGGRYVGGYADVFYRLPGLPAWTLAARAEQLRPSPHFGTARQQTLGVRWTASSAWTLVLNWRTNRIAGRYPGTWVPQTPSRGAWIAQVYRSVSLGK